MAPSGPVSSGKYVELAPDSATNAGGADRLSLSLIDDGTEDDETEDDGTGDETEDDGTAGDGTGDDDETAGEETADDETAGDGAEDGGVRLAEQATLPVLTSAAQSGFATGRH